MIKFFKKNINKIIPIVFLIGIAFIFFYKFFLYKLISIPTDIIVGMYYPWLNQKWGFVTNVPVKNPLMSDIVSIVYQWRIMVINSIKEGHFPFWNRQYFLGMPLFANFQNSLFNLTNLPFFLTKNNGIAWSWMVLFQLIFSLLSSYYCFLILKFKKISSLIGSIIFSFSLFSIVWLEYGIHTYVAAFLPLLIICIEKYNKTKKQKFLVLLSVFIALQFYGGYPQYSIFSLIFSSLYFLLFVNQKLSQKILKLFIYCSLGLFLTAPLLIPGYELINRSIHNIDNTSQDLTSGFLPITNLFTIPVANFYGNPTTYDYVGSGFYDNNSIFPGTIALISLFFIIFLFFKKKLPSKIKFFLFTIIFSFLIAIKNPFSNFLKENLGLVFSGNGISTRIFLLANFSIAAISAYFIDNISKIKQKFSPLVFVILIWQLILLILSHFKIIIFSPVSFKNILYSLLFSVPISLVLFFSFFFKKHFLKKIFPLLLLFLTIIELFYFGLKYLPFSKSEYLFPNTPSIEYLQKNSNGYRISTTNTIPGNMWTPYNLSSPDGSDATLPLINYEYLSLLQGDKYQDYAKRSLVTTNTSSNLYKNLSVKYKLTQEFKSASNPKDEKLFFTVLKEKNTLIQEDKNVLPKVRFVKNIIFLKDKNEFKDNYKNIDFANSAVVYSNNQDFFSKEINNCTSTNSNIKNINENNNSLSFQTENNCSQLVFISNSFFPGWIAKIDNKKTPIFQTNHMFQSVLIPAGQHQIVLNYYPTHLNIAIVLALFSGTTLLVIFLYEKNKK